MLLRLHPTSDLRQLQMSLGNSELMTPYTAKLYPRDLYKFIGNPYEPNNRHKDNRPSEISYHSKSCEYSAYS